VGSSGSASPIHIDRDETGSTCFVTKGLQHWLVLNNGYSFVDAYNLINNCSDKCDSLPSDREDFYTPADLYRLNIPFLVAVQRPGDMIVVMENTPQTINLEFTISYINPLRPTTTVQSSDQFANALIKSIKWRHIM
jgi:hypothetical protein